MATSVFAAPLESSVRQAVALTPASTFRLNPASLRMSEAPLAFAMVKQQCTHLIACCTAETEQKANLCDVRIHYHRGDCEYKTWGLHIWGDTNFPTSWERPLSPDGLDDFGLYWDVRIKCSGRLEFIVHKGDTKDNAGSIKVSMHQEIWLISGNIEVLDAKPTALKGGGNLNLAKSFWVQKDLLAWPEDIGNAEFFVHAARDCTLWLSEKGIKGSDAVIKLQKDSRGIPSEVLEKFPHIRGYVALKIPPFVVAKELVRCQLAVVVLKDGGLLDASGVQLSGVLDDLFSYDGPLGAVFTKEGVSLYLWAPTAQAVKVIFYSSSLGDEPEEILELDEQNGTWAVHGPTVWIGKFYVFEVTVFHPMTQKIERCIATDPYSHGLSANGERSLIIDLNDPSIQPKGWETLAHEKSQLKRFTDITTYELHIRDFSASDESVDPLIRGTYLAFTSKDSAGVRHLKELAECGLTHIHLLPSFDFASVDEKKENWQSVDEPRLLSLPPDSEEQQRAIVAIQDEDGYNWGYDPVSWGVPEGSYSTDPNGSKRCLEFREMIQALNKLGLRVILDVVYNHLHGKGPYDKFSVLDKVVPGYYLRRNLQGEIENSTCMNNTASEHYMVDRLIVDDLRHWVVDYKVDGFRFDLMGHLMKKTMLHAKRTLQSLTLEHDGVDGSNIYLYGEGWDFGEVAGNARGINASQHNLAGTGIGSFNDRIRDAAMGGSPFADPRQQGFLTGLFLKPNTFPQGDEMTMRKALLAAADSIQVGLAGNLRDYIFLDHNGNKRRGVDLLTNDGRSVAYAASPEETINYVSAHDNETLFDIIMLKTSEDVSLADRCRINTLASSIVAFSQGVPFFHAGDDLLRSKSLDRDSYNSGDWFNRLDFTYETNNWGVGLPPKEKNGTKWNIMRKLLSDSSLKPNKMDIIFAKECFKTLLRIRYSSPLFRLRTATEVKERVKFYNNGPSQIPGVAVMSIEDGHEGLNTLSQLDALYQTIIILFNARPDTVSIFLPLFQSRKFSLHPLQMDSVDEIVKKSEYDEGSGFFSIPARTTAVFVESRYSS